MAPDAVLSLSSKRGRWVLAVTILGSAVAFLEATVVNVALPEIGRDLDASVSGLQWVLNGYLLTLAALILLGGSLGDRYGRRRLFSIGIVWFTVASALCALAPSIEFLVVARVLQGVGGALLAPGSLAIIEAAFRSEDRPRAIGAWSALGGVAGAIGPLVGGYLIDAISWRAVFLISVPLGAFVVVAAARHVPETRDTTATGGVDVPGAVLATLALA
ncbi:MAG: MFS transporter, partial [Thermoleophilaceae bacterium]|nr:MFS transporter [Thermoleophilaceae bacterium]